MENEVRWEQRFAGYCKALEKLSISVALLKDFVLETDKMQGQSITPQWLELAKEGLIQRFEYTHELAWNVMKDYAHFQGNTSVSGSKDATREGFALQLITDGKMWMDMISSRNKTSHTYNEATATQIYERIVYDYYPCFTVFRSKMDEKRNGSQLDIFAV